jgi:hypothetical protein
VEQPESIDAPVSITWSTKLTLRPDREFGIRSQKKIGKLRETGAG